MVDTFTPEQIAQILEEFFKVVGTRKYIGERYVPIFGRKGEESIQWDNSAPYEPLTIVLYQGNSYTSRQYVPIGVEITNQEFWVITGNYNAQVEAYHRETIAAREIADNAITTANNAQNDINTLLPKADFSAENTVKKYIDENPTRVLTFGTVADMQAATMLKSGMVCHTNGFHVSGDGGAAYYTVSANGTANGMDVLALQNGLFATLVATKPYVTPEQFGAWGDGTHDDTAAIQAAVDSGYTVNIGRDLTVYGTVELPANSTIVLGAIRVIKPATAENDNPIFYLGHSFSSIVGVGPSSVVRSYRPSPDGVVKVGQPSNTQARETIIYCQVSDMTIRGTANSDSNIGVHLCGTFDSTTYYASYFHMLSNLVIHTCAMGLVFNNAANANIVSNIHFIRCGYNRTTGALCFIRTQGDYSIQRIPLENVITNAFHHDSANSTTMYFGTALMLNRIDNIVCEQGGSDSHVYVVNPDEPTFTNPLARNVIKYTNNSNAGTVASDKFKAGNTIESQSSYRNDSIIAQTSFKLKGVEQHDSGKTIYVLEASELNEGSTYNVGALPTNINGSGFAMICKIMACTYSGPAVPKIVRVSEATYQAIYLGSGTPTVSLLGDKVGTLNCAIDSSGQISLTIPNNGTSTVARCRVLVELIGFVPAVNAAMTINQPFERTN